MHSSPIDLPAKAPKRQNPTPTESEPDGRFSELLRGASEAESGTPDTVAPSGPTQAAPVDGAPEDKSEARPPLKAENHAPDSPAADSAVISPVTAPPEAITWAQPQVGVIVDGAAAGAAELSAGVLSTEPPKAATAAAAPATPPAAPNASGAPIPANPAIGVPPGPPAQEPSASVTPIASPSPTAPSEPGASGAIATGSASSSPTALAQPAVTADTNGAATGKAVLDGGVPGEPARTGPVAQDETNAAKPVASDRPGISATPSPERMLTAHARTPVAAEPAARQDHPDLPAAPAPKTDAGPTGAAAALPATKPGATPTATFPVIDKAAAAQANRSATAIPSTVAEIADAAPSASQTDSAAAANSAPIGRMTVTAGSSALTAPAQAAPQPAAEQVVLQVQRAVRDGVDRLTMQLKPASLGRVDIQMEVGFDGRLQAVISAERPETLNLLQRDARALTDALNDAGLQTDNGSLSFNLRGESGEHGGGDGNEPSGLASASPADATDDAAAATTEITLTLGDGRVDIKV